MLHQARRVVRYFSMNSQYSVGELAGIELAGWRCRRRLAFPSVSLMFFTSNNGDS
jgi:hypothetical protein